MDRAYWQQIPDNDNRKSVKRCETRNDHMNVGTLCNDSVLRGGHISDGISLLMGARHGAVPVAKNSTKNTFYSISPLLIESHFTCGFKMLFEQVWVSKL